MNIFRTPCMTNSPGYTLLLGAKERWKDRAVCAAMRSSPQPVFVMESSVLNPSRVADGFIIGNSMEANDAVQALIEYERISGHRPATVIPLFEPAIAIGQAISRRFDLPYLSEDAVRNIRSKYNMRRAFELAGLPVPKYVQLVDANELGSVPQMRFPVIVKPESLGGGLGVQLVNSRAELPAALAASKDSAKMLNEYGMYTQSFVVEEFIEAVAEVSVEVLNSASGQEVVGMTDKVLSGPPHFVECAHRFPSRYKQDQAVRDAACRACSAVGLDRGLAHVEIRISTDGSPFIVEVNGRPPGGAIPELIERCTGHNLFELHCGSFLGTHAVPRVRTSSHMRGCSAIVFLKAREGRITHVNPVDISKLPDEVAGLYVWASPGDVSGKGESNFERHGAVEFFWDRGRNSWADDDLIEFAEQLSDALFAIDG